MAENHAHCNHHHEEGDHKHHHSHNHALGHHHHHGAEGNIKLAFWLNISFAIFELIGGFFTSSIAILSDALHDFGDALSLGVAWYLQNLSKKGRDTRYSYGYRRFSLLGALFISTVLIVGSIFVIKAAAERLFNPGEPRAGYMLLIAIVGLFVNGVAAFRVSKGHSFNERAVMLHLLEDVLGWAAVLIVSIVMLFVDMPILDPILSIVISCWVLFNVFRTLRSTFSVLLQGVPAEISLDKIEERILKVDKVLSLHDLHIWTIDGEMHVITLHVVYDKNRIASSTELFTLKEEIRTIIRELGVQHATIEMDTSDEDCSMISCYE